MLLFCVTMLLALHDSLGVPPTVNDDFPEMEFPQSVLDNIPYHLKKPSRVLDPFSEDVKTNFQAIENSKNSNKASTSAPTLIDILAPVSNKDGSITDIHNVDIGYVPFEENSDITNVGEINNFKEAESLTMTADQEATQGSIQTYSEVNETKYEAEKTNQETDREFSLGQHNVDQITKDDENIKTGNSNVNILSNEDNLNYEDTEGQAEVPFVLNQTENLNRKKRSSNVSQESESLDNISDEERLNGDKNITSKNYTKSTKSNDFTSSEVVLPRPPLSVDYDDGIVIEDFKESNEETLLADNCLENCVIEKSNVNEDHNVDF